MFIKVFLKNDEYDLHAKKEKVFVIVVDIIFVEYIYSSVYIH